MKHQDLLNKMTLDEKAAILSGMTEWETRNIDRLNIPSMFCSDGPHGIRKQEGDGDHLGLNASVPATCFPTAATVANSWDPELGEEIGKALGEEAVALNVNVILGPGLNVKRNPLCGRNFEYFSEDPYLAGKMAASYIKGIQSKGVVACPKHYAVNSQELRRMASDSVLDERTLREIYLTNFEIAVKEGNAKAIMSAYNQVNEVYANENKHLLQDILRDEWGFDGIVITDWGASNDHTAGVAAGSNLEMPAPGLGSARELLKSIEEGRLTEKELDECVDTLLDAILTFAKKEKSNSKYDKELHHEIAKKAAGKSAVLLKNEENILPLKEGTKVAVIGDFAIEPRFQGAGSSVVNATKIETIANTIAQYKLENIGIAKGYDRIGKENNQLLEEAKEIASKADVVLYFFGLDELSESEGLDRQHMKIPANQIKLLEELSKVNKNIVGVLSAGSAIETPWDVNCKGLLHGYLSGQAGAGALLDIITGKINPSGKLNETLPVKYEDVPSYNYFPSKERTSEYREGIFVGYRYYDTAKVPVKYPFGYGLSYTTFEYSDINVAEDKVTFTITNTGKMDGEEIAQMYVSCKSDKIYRPKKELKGFKKVFLKAGECKQVEIPFDDKTFRYFNVKTNKFEIETAEYVINIASNVEDVRISAEISIKGTEAENPYDKEKMPSYYNADIKNVDDKQFETLLGRKIPDGSWSGELSMYDAFCQLYYAKRWVGRLVYKILTSIKKKSEAKGKPDLNILFIYNMPFYALAKMTGGMVSTEMAQGIVSIWNGHFFKGVGRVIKGFFANNKANKEYEKRLLEEK
ncbi:glycoside hydrolase family 3 C-terminal domain-containing protein [Eubacterium sp. AF19-12LB]|uniref:glycoside hydrolase family 3 C-terminal domain-containing protein n=1 Tax=Eubacterium sp. AF19-12LB TaxID=2293106 RepID=UPI000E46ABC2|nr:glycoside hydrolase family 3 C-terminal domain-containing protein [Eubacterium sp. AF19-12LB]RHR34584.1 glycosyl hydrolase [Eubacterium sp. AF19-12LB]